MSRHSIFRCISLLAVISSLLIASGCSEQPPPPIRVGINPWPGYEFLYLAQEKGFYRDEGVDVRLIEFNSLSDARRAYERGQIDAMGTTVIEVLQVRDQSARSPQIVQVIDYSNGGDVIIARPGIKKGSDLRGTRIGVELASLGVYVLARGLAASGLTLKDVIPISMDQLSMEEALGKGDLDAVVSYPPTSINLLRDSKLNKIFSTTQIPGEVIDVIAVEEEIITRRPADVAKLLRAFHQAIEYSKQNRADAYRIMAAREGITAEEFGSVLADDIQMVNAADQAAYFQPGGKLATVIDFSDHILRESGQIKGVDHRAKVLNASFVGPSK